MQNLASDINHHRYADRAITSRLLARHGFLTSRKKNPISTSRRSALLCERSQKRDHIRFEDEMMAKRLKMR